MVKKSTFGFTLVELTIVVVIIGILSAIGAVSYSVIQAGARDSRRSSEISAISSALEKYYDKNGEYPSCSSMSASVESVTTRTLIGINSSVLSTPTAANGANSILAACADLPAGVDSFAYIGDGSSTCLSSNCLQYILKYRHEADSKVISVASRHKQNVSTSGSLNLSVSLINSTQLNLSWNDIENALNYNIQYATNSTFTSGLQTVPSITGTTTTISSLNAGMTYFFAVQTVSSTSTSGWSGAVSATTTVNMPSIPVGMSISSNASTTTWNWLGAACQNTTTAQYQYDFTNTSGYDSGWVGPITGTSINFSTSTEGTSYALAVRARCQGMNAASNYSGSSSPSSYTRPYTPPILVLAASNTTPLAGTAVTLTLNSGKSVSSTPWCLGIYDATAGSYLASISSGTTLSTTVYPVSNHTYVGYATTSLSGGTVASSSNAIVTSVVAISTPGTPAIYASTSGGTTSWSWSAVACQSGAVPYYSYDYSMDNGYDSGWVNLGLSTSMTMDTSGEGYNFAMATRAQCRTSGSSGSWGASSGNATYLRPISTPGVATNFSGSMSSDRTRLTIYWTAPTCGSWATIGYSRQNPYASGNWDWSDTGTNGYLGWSATNYWSSSYYVYVTNGGGLPYYLSFSVQVQYICINNVTGRQSSWGAVVQSPAYSTN
jgi:prepilin-type N-terminal cleavage/methylation domain-containing protein